MCATLIGVSVWLYSRPEPFSIVHSGPQAILPAAEGLLVDLDPLKVEWTSSGKEETVSVFLENVDSQRRSGKKTVSSSVRSVRFDPADVLAVATDRTYHGKNRVRSVIEWPGVTSASEPKDIAVGIEVDLLLYGKLVTPDGGERTIHTLFATIDRSTQALPEDYAFKGDFAAMTATGPLVVPLGSRNSDGEVSVPGLDRVDWGRPLGFVYGGPDDPRIVRTRVSGKSQARELTTR